MTLELPKHYSPNEVEDDIYQKWLKSGYFTPENLPDFKNREPYTIVLPPPNVTGTLHMGHAVMLAIEDAMIRFARLRGKRALWLPGTDHAAIATESKVEKLLIEEEGKTRHDLGREKFLARVNKFAQDSHDTIINQMKKMGASVDWTREAYTLDDTRNLAVRTAFKKMYDDGLIYRGYRVVNWDAKGQTTVSDDEVEYIEKQTKLYTFKYWKDFPISISTTRPETKVGDTAVAVNPADERYKDLIGREFEGEFAGAKLKIRIVADDSVDKDFGTGALGVTPAHSAVDAEIAKRNDLPMIQVIDEQDKMMPSAGNLVTGLSTKEARKAVVNWLRENDLLEHEEDITHNLAVAQRSGGVIEPLPKMQWFIDVNHEFEFKKSKCAPIKGLEDGQKVTLKQLMQHVVREGEIEILPDRFDKTYFSWVDNLRDWNISRQIWFGHRVPVWYRSWAPFGKEYVMGFHERTIPSVIKGGKTVTYRQRDHGVKEGDMIALENSQSGKIIGYGTIQKVVKTTVENVPLNDPAHGATYKKREELVQAFGFHHPELNITNESPIWIYTFSFGELVDEHVKEIYVGLEEPKGEGWEQDEDTLDTWFSSGLWTFSTLGWPNESEDLKIYHPTSVLETGYDIIFFWVARMILMSTYSLGEVPFRTVYLHGLVRTEDGKKMSKSLGNIIDPLEMIEKYGADATRLSLLIGSTPGNDSRLSEQKISSFRNFTNKLWNISRFAFMNVEDVHRVDNVNPATLDDKWILAEFSTLVKEVTVHFENYQYSLLGEKLREFTWSKFADVYLENAKVQGGKTTSDILLYILERLLILWHPFAPFVTEEIYKNFGNDLLMIANWPEVPEFKMSEEEIRHFTLKQSIIERVRLIRAEKQLPWREQISINLFGCEAIQEQDEVLKKMLKLDEITWAPGEKPQIEIVEIKYDL